MKTKIDEDKCILLYLALMFTIFPLAFHNYYYDLQETKCSIFMFSTAVCMILFLIVYMIRKQSNLSGIEKRSVCFNRVTALLLFFSCWTFLSALSTEDIKASFLGSNGRGMGVLWIFCCLFAFFLASNLKNYSLNIPVYLIGSTTLLILLIGILQAKGSDIGGFLDNVPDYMQGMYLSTIGYINYISQYSSFVVIIMTAVFCLKESVLIFVFLFTGYCGLIIGNSDAGVLAVGVTLAVFPLLVLNSYEKMQRFVFSLFAFPISGMFVWIIQLDNFAIQEQSGLIILLKTPWFCFLTAIIVCVNVNIRMLKKWKIKMYIFQELFLSLCFHKGPLFFQTV